MTSVPATELPDGARMALPRPAPHVRTYLLPCVLSLVLFFPTAIVGIVHAVKARGHLREDNIRDARAQGDLARQWFWMTVGIGLTVWFCLLAVLSIFLNDGALRKVFFNWDVISDSWASIRKGFWLNIKLFMTAEVLVLIWALFIAILRGLPGRAATPLRFLAVAYIDLFRALPAVIVIYLIAFGVPLTNLPVARELTQFQLCVIALTLVYGAYVAEVYRAGIESIHWSQSAGARSLGLSYSETMRFVVVPQAVRRIIPPLLNDFIGLQKDTALVGFVGLLDAFNRARIIASNRFNLSAVTGVAISYIVITIPLAVVVDHLVRRDQQKMRANAVTSYLEVEGVTKCFGDNWVLRGIDMSVNEHEVVCLIGASGSGKSTLLRCINLLEHVDGGTITINGDRITDVGVDVDDVRREVGIVFQSFNLFPHMTVMKNITLAPIRVLGQRKAYAEAGALELLERIGLTDKANEYPDRLSGGQQQRVAIVRALAMQPRVLLLDEITSALDPELVAEVLNIVRDLKDDGLTMVLATHEMGFAREVASRVCFLSDGVVCEEGPPEQIFSEPATPRLQGFLRRIIEAGRL